jgi:predicted alpha/beta hydrolase family esterase
MRTLIFPGFSLRNKEWAYNVRNKLDLDHEIIVLEWRHWKTGSTSFAIKHELEKAITLAGDEKFNIIAKSVGTRLAARIIEEIPKRINKVILCGIPTKGKSDAAKKNYSPLSDFNERNIIVYQNQKDPFASYKDIKIFLGSINKKIKIIKKPRKDHHYPYTKSFNKFLEE